MEEPLLSPYRALDLTDEKGFFCGRILGDFGADVIKIEPPGGDSSRRIGPFYHDLPDPEKSLYWFAYNANKRGVTLNIETADGQELFRRLVKTADFVIESFPPGYMDKIGLGYASLSQINPGIIMTSITPFGQTGPWRDHKGSDIALWALSSYMYVEGDADRAPVRFGFPQAYLHAGLEAAVSSLVALHYRQMTGEGQWIDVSAQQSLIVINLQNQQHWNLARFNPTRAGPCVHRSGVKWAYQRRIWQCKDGFVCFILMAGATGAPGNRALTEWMESEGLAPGCMKQIDWPAYSIRADEIAIEDYEEITKALTIFFSRHTKAELYQEAIKRRIPLYPCSTMQDLRGDAHLKERGFWTEIEHPELKEALVYPRPCMLLSGSSCRIRRRAPRIGEHNEEVYGMGLGLSRQEMILLKQAGAI
ncbi:MAG: CoA transferase [Chloroflexi bacterium]|nr:CoA transferase [Chloroflexota bacterium]